MKKTDLRNTFRIVTTNFDIEQLLLNLQVNIEWAMFQGLIYKKNTIIV